MMDELSETDRIERDLARTRARMDGRLDELQDHLTPKQMINDVFGYFRSGDGADFTQDLVTRARANPIPVALTGIGIAWLMASGQGAGASVPDASRPTPAIGSSDLEMRLRMAAGGVQRLDHDDDDSYADRLHDARGKVVGVARDAADTAASYAQRIKDAVASAGHAARATSHDLTAGASAHGTHLQEGTQTMAHSTRSALSSIAANPFALGGIAAVVGLVAGSLLPVSDEEEHALGNLAGKVRTTGRDLAQDVVDRGGRVANETLDAVKGSAEAHGLSVDKPVGELLGAAKSGDLAASVKQVAQETLRAGKDSAQTNLAGATTSNRQDR